MLLMLDSVTKSLVFLSCLFVAPFCLALFLLVLLPFLLLSSVSLSLSLSPSLPQHRELSGNRDALRVRQNQDLIGLSCVFGLLYIVYP